MAEDRQAERGRPPRLLIGLAVVGAIAAALLFSLSVLRLFAFQPFTMHGASMEPNMRRGDYFIVIARSFAPSIQRGDVIVFARAGPDGREFLARRIVGIPGDRVQMRVGRLYINGRPLKEAPARLPAPSDDPDVKGQLETNLEGRSYLTEVSPTIEVEPGLSAANTGIYVVPPHCYFGLGDNRDDAVDSRFPPTASQSDLLLRPCPWTATDADAPIYISEFGGFVPEADIVGDVSWNVTRSLGIRPQPGPDPE